MFSSLYIMSACCVMNAPFPTNGNRGAGPRGEGVRTNRVIERIEQKVLPFFSKNLKR